MAAARRRTRVGALCCWATASVAGSGTSASAAARPSRAGSGALTSRPRTTPPISPRACGPHWPRAR
eukprot:11208457-Lingulodinium_polyedra.AAC.1